jgi:catechol 2,3-dioxygenase-like lactoylglutathione lyase family enzyme
VRHTISRRSILSAGAGILVAAATRSDALFSAEKEGAPTMLDHILLGCSDLDRGIDFVEKHTGVRAAFGGVHPGRGTRNALLSLGEKHYLEIIALDPQQSGVPDHYWLQRLIEPRLVGWAAHPGDLNLFATRLRDADIAFDGPNPGSRKRPDGRLLQWKTLNLKDDHAGLLPFFIEWSADTVHPSADAPTGCRIVRFEIATPEPEQLGKTVAILGLDVKIAKAEIAQLRATIAGPKGELALTS